MTWVDTSKLKRTVMTYNDEVGPLYCATCRHWLNINLFSSTISIFCESSRDRPRVASRRCSAGPGSAYVFCCEDLRRVHDCTLDAQASKSTFITCCSHSCNTVYFSAMPGYFVASRCSERGRHARASSCFPELGSGCLFSSSPHSPRPQPAQRHDCLSPFLDTLLASRPSPRFSFHSLSLSLYCVFRIDHGRTRRREHQGRRPMSPSQLPRFVYSTFRSPSINPNLRSISLPLPRTPPRT